MELRRLTSLMLFACAAVTVVSSTILYVAPQWHVNHWTGWTLLGAGKEAWASVHMNFGILMLIAAAVHAYLNFDHIAAYVKRSVQQLLTPSKELVIVLALMVTLLVGTLLSVPPFEWPTIWHKDFQARAGARYGEPPLPWMEMFPLGVVALRLDFDLDAALQRVAAAGFEVDDSHATIYAIALANGTTSQAIYQAMQVPGPEGPGS